MEQNFDKCLEMLLVHEGGWSKHSKDPGGSTMKGVTKKVYEEYLGRECTDDELLTIKDEEVAEIYRKRYWDKIKGDDLPDGVDWSVFDWAVNSGPSRAAKYLQGLVGATEDGIIGPRTMERINSTDTVVLIQALANKRDEYYRSLKTFEKRFLCCLI